MPIQINYLDNGTGIEIIASGIVTGEEIIKANNEIYKEENIHKQRYHIIDRTHCTKYQVLAEEIEAIAEIDNRASEKNPNMIIAIVSPTPLQYGMTEMWRAYLKSDRFITRNFLDRESANKWIKSYIECQLA
jgi:hypothetical protein